MTKTSDTTCNPFGEKDEIQKKTKVEENGSSFQINSKEFFHLIKIDKGLLKNEVGSKADYLVLLCKRKETLFIELKGRQNFDKACMQIYMTHAILKAQLDPKFKNIAIIVQKEFNKNDLLSTGYKKLVKEFGTKNIIKKNNQIVYQ
ncbi:hypothetical protein EGI26_01105 [Lacihabitans sp. CCS-44]|uniref:hypothetical protein n=1 Tax=Lacihabitans sp. CCS-44 TaxID=2487331 RepID=UPI0020CFC9F0|nr:hypothetical protein [Lacihabitans sp. CCS-44]MCP9753761.1 hypothetical protein [Lacihabitans sp. CCS-44]